MERRPLLEAWLCLQECLYAELADGTRAHAECDPTQVGDRRLSAVQYLMFNVPDTSVALGCDLPVLEGQGPVTKDSGPLWRTPPLAATLG